LHICLVYHAAIMKVSAARSSTRQTSYAGTRETSDQRTKSEVGLKTVAQLVLCNWRFFSETEKFVLRLPWRQGASASQMFENERPLLRGSF